MPKRTLPAATILYRMWGGGELLYVGISHDARRRWAQHSAFKEWSGDVDTITLERFATRGEAEAAEVVAIRNECPKFNFVGNIKPANINQMQKAAQRAALTPEQVARIVALRGEGWTYRRIADEIGTNASLAHWHATHSRYR